ncbi:hypothetical protein OF83DRAFT_1196593 [Amylostereum chailletii]|nr:hypothetical protein OF83DRAFT_1196593 [Amylostereum chailletii]
MKDIVGDAVGNMSISPSYRDVVLAARKGLFIIDLEAPLELPRFLPQGGTWDVADVQWNPHPARAEYVVSTSSEKLLIWNLGLSGPTSIQHVLRSHYRAITDINWHTQDPNIVVSTGIDSWLWAWDLRTTQKPIMGAFRVAEAGTQVKWNRQDGHLLASSHMNEVLIWDRRKGSIPIIRIEAHSAKIYGIDWAHNDSREIVTCSLDGTIKVWNLNDLSEETIQTPHPSESPDFVPRKALYAPRTVIKTTYPVWRARDLPFGRGVLSLPQRNEDHLELWRTSPEDPTPELPVEVFEGHNDVVKEFVWRRGGRDWSKFQLITWSKDKTLRFCPIDMDIMEQRAGKPAHEPVPPRAQGYGDPKFSFRTPLADYEPKPALSAPVGHRGILAGVRAPPPSRPQRHHEPGTRQAPSQRSSILTYPSQSSRLSQSQTTESEPDQTPTTTTIPIPVSAALRRGTMSRGNLAGKSALDNISWLSSVKVAEKPKDGSSGTGSGATSGNASRVGSRSRPTSREPSSGRGMHRRSSSRGRREDDVEPLSLQDEITSTLTKLASFKIKLEKHDLTKRRTCTLGLNGPWGETSSVFVRVTFTFPKEYPQSYPGNAPAVDIEPTPLIPLRSRAHMLRRLRSMLERRPPCLEACLKFLLLGDEDDEERHPVHMDMDTSSDEEGGVSAVRKGRDAAVNILHNDKNIAEPRTSQGVFGPDGALVCFNRAPPRIVRNILNELSTSPSVASRPKPSESIPRLFKSPALISDAVRRLAVASQDHTVSSSSRSSMVDEGDNILHIMTNLLMFSRHKQRRPSETSRAALDEIPASYALLPTRTSTVFLKDESYAVNAGREMADEHVLGLDPVEMCEKNAAVAAKYGRGDHKRFFETMGMLFTKSKAGGEVDGAWGANPLTCHLVMELYDGFAREKDIQMLAILAVLVLKMYRPTPPVSKCPPVRVASPNASTPSSAIQRTDYFGMRRRGVPPSPGWIRPASSPTTNVLSTSLSSLSSRGSWSSLFNTGNVRQFVSGAVETPNAANENANTNAIAIANAAASADVVAGIPVPGGGRRRRTTLADSPQFRPAAPRNTSDSPRRYPSPTMKSWPDAAVGANTTRLSVTFASGGHAAPTAAPRSRRPTFSQVVTAKTPASASIVICDLRPGIRAERAKAMDLFKPEFVGQLVGHVVAYAEILFRWQLLHKRIELLKAVDRKLMARAGRLDEDEDHALGTTILCTQCENKDAPRGHRMCLECGGRLTMPLCSFCRLPVKGLSYSCLSCQHVSHISCWRAADVLACAAGCGCWCKTNEAAGARAGGGRVSASPATGMGSLLQPLTMV